MTRMVNISDSGTIRLDVPGLATFAGSMFLLVFGLIRANADGWTSTTICHAVRGAAVLDGAVRIRRACVKSTPMLDLSLFRKPSFTGVSIGTFAIGAGMFALLPYMTFYLQNDLGYSPMQGGLRLLPSAAVLRRAARVRASPRDCRRGSVSAADSRITGVGLVAMTAVTAKSSWTRADSWAAADRPGHRHREPDDREDRARSRRASTQWDGVGDQQHVPHRRRRYRRRCTRRNLPAKSDDVTGEQPWAPGTQLAKVVASAGVRAAVAAGSSTPGIAVAAHGAFLSGLRLILVIGACVVIVGAVSGAALVRRQ